jgi:hypothetical protein
MKIYPTFKKWGYAVVLGAQLSVPALAQIPTAPKSVQSPTTASLGTYGNVPVSLFTGKPEISVNLHTISEQGMNIPISLTYDASGVRPDAHSGWVGLNWNLSTTYAVIRTMKDGPDDHRFEDSRGKLGYAFTRSLVNDNNWNTPTGMQSIADQSFLGRDMEPDEYSFSLPDISGKFYLGHDGQFKVQCDRPVKVEWISTTFDAFPPFTPPTNQVELFSVWKNQAHYREHAPGFYITDEFGTRYEFGGTNAYCEYGIDFFAQGTETWNVNSWYLKQIKKSTGQVIDFKYERGELIAQMYMSLYQATYSKNGAGFLATNCSSNPPFIPPSGAYFGSLISPLYLKEITTQNYKVNFESNTSNELRYDEVIFSHIDWHRYAIDGPHGRALDIVTYLYPCFYPPATATPGCADTAPSTATLLTALKWRKLNKIQIQTSAGTTLKEFEFTYNNISTERLILQKVQEKSGTKVIPPYQFTYFESSGILLPNYLRNHTDHWGFNNGQKVISPADFAAPNTLAGYGATFRSPNTDSKYVKLSTLTKIQYPTGGFTEFEFEPHTYSKQAQLQRWQTPLESHSSNQLAGGLRIRQIKSNDPNISSSVMTKTFTYVSNFNPANPNATLLSSGILGGKSQYYWAGYQPKPNASYSITSNIFSTQSVLPTTENSQGSHIGYSEVVESSSTGGWTVHKFTNFDTGQLDGVASGSLQPSYTAYQPFNSIAYQRGKKLSEHLYLQNGNPTLKTVYQYALVGDLLTNSARAEKTLRTKICETDSWVYEATAYLIDVRKYLVSSQVVTRYGGGNPTDYTEAKSYTYWPNGQLNVSGDLQSDGVELKTAYKYPPNFSDATSIAMTTKNIIGTPLSIFTFTGTEASPSPLKQQTVEYELQQNLYLPKRVKSGSGTVLPIPLTTDIEFKTYDIRGNLTTYTDRSGLATKLDYYLATDAGKVDMLKTTSLMDGSTAVQTTTYDYKAVAGIQSISDPNSKVLFYEYDEFNRLINVRNSNVGGSIRSSYCYNYAGQAVPCTALAPTGSIAASSLELLLTPDAALPVILVDFEAAKAEKMALLTWSTTAETNSERFDVERSKDAKEWMKIGSVDASGESSELLKYTFTDNLPANGENLYRLKMIDKDQTFAYSRIRSLIFDSNGNVVLHPNPITIGEKLKLQTDDLAKISLIQIYDTSGKLLLKSKATREINTGMLGSGLYMVQITFIDGSISTHRIVKQ